jgi:thymidylate kinase
MPAPDVLVIVSCDPEVRLARVRRENRRYARDLNNDEIVTLAMDHLARRFAAARHVPVVEIDTTEDPNPVLLLRQELRRYLGHPTTFSSSAA